MPMFMTSAVRGLLLRTIDVCGKGGNAEELPGES